MSLAQSRRADLPSAEFGSRRAPATIDGLPAADPIHPAAKRIYLEPASCREADWCGSEEAHSSSAQEAATQRLVFSTVSKPTHFRGENPRTRRAIL